MSQPAGDAVDSDPDIPVTQELNRRSDPLWAYCYPPMNFDTFSPALPATSGFPTHLSTCGCCTYSNIILIDGLMKSHLYSTVG